jgi:uncharacterized protein YuzE
MATKLRDDDLLLNCMELMHKAIGKIPLGHLWIDYDEGADVLYVSFRKPQRATKTIETDDDMLIRKDGRQVVGLTILHASTR